MTHRYRVGQMLELRSAPQRSNRPAGTCEVLACLPHDSGPLLYRVRSRTESNDRVVDEVDLSPSTLTRSVQEQGGNVFSIAVKKR